MKNYGIRKGFSELRGVDQKKVKAMIWRALDVKSATTWYAMLSGDREPRISEAEKMLAIFSRFGVTDPWGDEESQEE